MGARIQTLAFLALLLAAPSFGQQDDLVRLRANLADGDLATASGTLGRMIQVPGTRWEALPATLALFREAAAVDAWLAVVDQAARAERDDPMLQFHSGAAWQSLKELGRAERGLGAAARLQPADPTIGEFWAWNAVYRFDAEAALERTTTATFNRVAEFRAEQTQRLNSRPIGRQCAALAGGLLVSFATAWLALRAARDR